LLANVLELLVYLEVSLRNYSVVVPLLIFDFLVLAQHDINLRVEHELFSNNIQLVLVQLLKLTVVVSPHFGVLLLEKRVVLERRLLIVEEGTDAALLLVFNNLFF
jgi:hypothetical protein